MKLDLNKEWYEDRIPEEQEFHQEFMCLPPILEECRKNAQEAIDSPEASIVRDLFKRHSKMKVRYRDTGRMKPRTCN